MMKIDFRRMAQLWPSYLVALVIVLLDQYTKALAVSHISYGQLIEILPVFDLTMLHNYGAAFSFLDQEGGPQRWFLAGISFAVSVLLIFWWLPSQQRVLSIVALTMILGGAIGNLYDRALLGYVVDFIAVHYQQHRFPAFNIADSAISVGAVLLFIEWFIFEPRSQRRDQNSSASESN